MQRGRRQLGQVLARDRKINLDPAVHLAPRLIDQPQQRICDTLLDLLRGHFHDTALDFGKPETKRLVGFGRKPVLVSDESVPKPRRPAQHNRFRRG